MGEIRCYTDGSRIHERTGAAYLVRLADPSGEGTNPAEQPETDLELELPLGTYPTVYQAEVFALLAAARARQKQAGNGPISYDNGRR